MKDFIEYILTNKEWIFSGIGVLLITIIYNIFSSKRDNKNIKQNVKTGNNSTVYLAGRDIKK